MVPQGNLGPHIALRDIFLLLFVMKRVAPLDIPLSNLLLRAAVDGQGVALDRQTLVGEDLESGRLIRLFDQGVRRPYAYYVVHPRGAQSVSKIRQFTEWLRLQASGLAS